MMEQTRKRREHDAVSGDQTETKRPRAASSDAHGDVGGDMGEDVMAWLLGDDDEAVSELLKCLDSEREVGAQYATRVRFIENPYSSQIVCNASCSYITINGNEESCGSSFSDCDCSVMASVDRGGASSNYSAEKNAGGPTGENEEEARGAVMVGVKDGAFWGDGGMGGYDGLDWEVDDDCLAWLDLENLLTTQ